jgi:hypothetical protein
MLRGLLRPALSTLFMTETEGP